MAQFFTLHPANPQLRLIRTAVEIIKAGGIIAYPTDSSYALGCHIGDAKALDKIRAIRQVGDEHNFTLVCADLSELGKYARIDNQDYRTIKRLTPGPYTFILPATREVPRRLQNPKRKTIGLRVPDYPIVTALLDTLGEPIMSSTLLLPGAILPLNDAFEIEAAVGNQIDLVIDGGSCDINPTTVLELDSGQINVAREGKGDISFL
ncbi:MAG: tRNA threonylcarbamoyl adenosine modification protein (Sua5/YciO/YrdC/YwlC family) [Saprospiraceae bacterium]|jgi:tRNA threonylcarbamoyl adenosine modification protein (Sua5/YciO/YrdC/YwlC family)